MVTETKPDSSAVDATHRPPIHDKWWTKGHWLFGGETWRVVSVDNATVAESLCIAVDDESIPLPFEAHRIEPAHGANPNRAVLTPHPESNWAKQGNEEIELERVPRAGENKDDPRELYRGVLKCGDREVEFFIRQGRGGNADDTATLLTTNPDGPGASGGSVFYRR
jgi:hypothetical protein